MIQYFQLINNYKWYFLLLLLVCLHIGFNLAWISLNNGPIPWDSANHTYHTIKITERILAFDLIGALKTSNYYPIFIYLVSAIPTIIFGANLKLLQFMGTIYFGITLIAVFYYLKLLTNSKKIAFFSTLIFSLSPVVNNQSRLLMLDIPSVGLLMLSLILLFKSNHLKIKKYSLWFFISCALLGLTKWTAILYLIVPAIFELIYFMQAKEKILILKNGLIGLSIFAALLMPWYLANWQDISYLGKVYAAGDKIANPQNPWSAEYILNYYKIYLYTQVSPIPALFFFFCLLPFIVLKKISFKVFVLLMIFVNYLFFTMITNKDGRFTMHLLVFTSLITVFTLERIEHYRKYLGNFLLFCLVGFMIFYYGLMTVRPESWEGYKLKTHLPIIGGLEFINVDDSLVKKVEINDWHFSTVIPDLVALEKAEEKELKITVVSEWYHFNPSNIRTYTKVKGVDLVVVTPDLPFLIKEFGTDHFPTEKDLSEFINAKDYILSVEKNIGSPYLLNMQAEKQLIGVLNQKAKCNEYTFTSVQPGESCIVLTNEILTSGSDLLVDNKLVTGDSKRISGYAEVSCPWGCTFGIISQDSIIDYPKFEKIKEYILPNGERVNLFKIIKTSES